MTNTRAWGATIRAEGVVYNPMGSGKFAPVDPHDIAAVAAKAITGDGDALLGATLDVTGAELLTTADQVDTLATVLGRPVRCVDVPATAAVEGLLRNGVPAPMANAVAESFAAVRDGHAARATDAVAKVLGRPPTTFAEWAGRNAAAFG